MTHFRVRSAVQQPPVQHASATDPGPHRDVKKVIEALCGAPSELRQRGRIDVSIKRDWHIEGFTDGSNEIEVPPCQFRSVRDVSEMRRCWIQINRPKRCDPNRANRWDGVKKFHSAADGFLGDAGRKFRQFHVARLAACSADKLGPARLDSAQIRHSS